MKELEDKIREALPHLKELTEGCFYGYDDEPCIKIVFKDENEVSFINILTFDKISMLTIDSFNHLDLELIGKDIMLNDVLNWLTTFERNTVKYVDEILCEWDLTSPYLKDQSEALINYLNEL